MPVPRLGVAMRARWQGLRQSLARHRRLSLAVLAVLIVGLVGVAYSMAGQAGGGTSVQLPRATVAERWSLLQLADRIEQGQVTAVALGSSDGGSAALLAQRQDGAYIAISLTTPVSAAAAALVSLGYGDLLTADLARLAASGQASSFDPLRSLINFALLGALLGVGGLMVYRMRDRLPSGVRSSTRFSTIMPATTKTGSSTAINTAAVVSAPAGSSEAVHLADVAGCDEAKLELAEPIEFLRDPARFHGVGARVPRGILLYGPPGTGKTMLARAVATEAGVPFHHASGSDFVEKYVGVGARRVRDLFAQARKPGQGRDLHRRVRRSGEGARRQNSHEEREQTLNQLLVELDGFGTSSDVVVIAATNRLDVLDEALLRPGRFSRKVHVALPDVAGRRAILDVHARGKPLGNDVDLDQVARKSVWLLRSAAGRPPQRGGDHGGPAGRARRSAPTTSTPAGSRWRWAPADDGR